MPERSRRRALTLIPAGGVLVVAAALGVVIGQGGAPHRVSAPVSRSQALSAQQVASVAGILRNVATRRDKALVSLARAKTPQAQSAIAQTIVQAYVAGTRSLRALAPSTRASSAVKAIVAALAASNTDYGRLSRAAKRDDGRAYASAAKAAQLADQRLQAAVDRLPSAR